VKNDLRVPYLFEVYKKLAGKETLNKETVTDTFNPKIYQPNNNRLRQSVAELAQAPHFPRPLKDSAEGVWMSLPFLSAVTKKQERIFVYLSPAIDTLSKTTYPLVIGLEAYSFGVAMPADRIIDELSRSKQITAPVFISVDYKSYNEQTDLDSLSIYLLNEVLPLLGKRFPVSMYASDITICGTSRRGLAASYIAFQHPDKIGKVLSMSGSFFWKPASENEFEWLSRQLALSKKKDIRFYISAGSLENVVTARNYGHYMVGTNRHLQNILTAKEYSFFYHEFEGVHHEVNWQFEFYRGLQYLLPYK
jgi:enterochelin esterase family protein